MHRAMSELRVCVFGSSSKKTPSSFLQAAAELGQASLRLLPPPLPAAPARTRLAPADAAVVVVVVVVVAVNVLQL